MTTEGRKKASFMARLRPPEPSTAHFLFLCERGSFLGELLLQSYYLTSELQLSTYPRSAMTFCDPVRERASY